MQRKLDEAKANTEASNIEIAKARAEANDRRAQLALLLLEGNQEIVTMRTKAITELANAEETSRREIQDMASKWMMRLDTDIGPKAVEKIKQASEEGVGRLGASVRESSAAIESKVRSTIDRLEAAKTPWIPKVLWALGKSSLLAPLALVMAVFAWMIALGKHLDLRSGIQTAFIASSMFVAITSVVLLIRFMQA